jgi:hypothetical protein
LEVAFFAGIEAAHAVVDGPDEQPVHFLGSECAVVGEQEFFESLKMRFVFRVAHHPVAVQIGFDGRVFVCEVVFREFNHFRFPGRRMPA